MSSAEKQDIQLTTIKRLGAILRDSSKPMKARNRALFGLKGVKDQKLIGAAIHEISQIFLDDSALLKHECAYCLGQMGHSSAIECLLTVLNDTSQPDIVRHEAGEALGAICNTSTIGQLESYINHSSAVLAETCQLALKRIEFYTNLQNIGEVFTDPNPYYSVDPAPPFLEGNITNWTEMLLNENESLFDRYRSLFSLRNLGSDEAILCICKGFSCKSVLFKHEIAYVLGQIQSKLSIPALSTVLSDLSEHSMVRHESAEALGAIGGAACIAALQTHLHDGDRVVRESCEVALDMQDYQFSHEFDYATTNETIPITTNNIVIPTT